MEHADNTHHGQPFISLRGVEKGFGDKRVLRGAIPLARLVMAQPETRLAVLTETRVLSCPINLHQNELAEFFDKYNLHALAVVDGQGRMVGVVQADHVISFLRDKL